MTRELCPDCHYPMISLRNYDGSDSTQAVDSEGASFPKSAGTGGIDELKFWFLIWGVISFLLKPISVFVGGLIRRYKAKRLQNEILPDWPDSLICPLCWNVTMRRK